MSVSSGVVLRIGVLNYRAGTTAIVTFSNVNFTLKMGGRTVSSTVVVVVGLVLNVDLCVDVTLIRLPVAKLVSNTGLSEEERATGGWMRVR